MRDLLVARGQLDWSAQPCGYHGIDALSHLELGRLRDYLVAVDKGDLAGQDDLRVLTALRLLTPAGELTYAGLLLLGRQDALRQLLPGHGYSFQYRPSSGSEATSRVREEQPVLAGIERMLGLVEAHAAFRPLNISGGIQLQLVDYPQNAVRELVVNAFLHRSYETHGTVDVEHSPEALIVTSPGGFLPGITPDNVLSYPSTPRNRLLTEVFSMLRLAERTGQGVDRAFRELLRVGKEPPTFTDLGTSVRAVVRGGIGDDAFVGYVSTLPAQAGRDVEILLTLSYLRTRQSVDAVTLARVVQRPAPESQEVLARMVALELVETTRRTAGRPLPTYRLRPAALAGLGRAVRYHRQGPAQTDEKVLEHVREYGYVTNRTLQRMFDVTMFGARDMLADLRRRGVLCKIGDAHGGTGVRYGPGDAFPRR
ncbi:MULTISPECIES: ATP-binding protein [unclassified Frankia]|uniref:ATP-binding protein n=1 Tax=unclassified Frankia TaxID=2632575 RepID=UPI002AD542D9|nr:MULTISPECIES: ATP-binding protein [unclassified Frankia]